MRIPVLSVHILMGAIAIITGFIALSALKGGVVPRKIARHLWRMCFALFVATGSFFLGQMKVMPLWMRVPGVLSIPVVLVLVTMVYWLWRMRRKRVSGGDARVLAAMGSVAA